MDLYAAIDIRAGKAVRLAQGDYERETAYDDPVTAARRWEQDGASWLHVVDLDGARLGAPQSLGHLRRIVAAVGVPIQFGGGLRDSKRVEEVISSGVERVVLGTAAARDPEMVEALVAAHGERVVVSVDTRGGRVAAEGWTRKSRVPGIELIRSLAERGVGRFIYTPVEVDGMMEGPDLDSLREVGDATAAQLIYSGGVGTVEHLRSLASIELPNLEGVIVGRALYEGRFSIAEGQAALGG